MPKRKRRKRKALTPELQRFLGVPVIEKGKPIWTIGRFYPERLPWPADIENNHDILSITTTEPEKWLRQ